MLTCPKCGRTFKKGRQYCTECGVKGAEETLDLKIPCLASSGAGFCFSGTHHAGREEAFENVGLDEDPLWGALLLESTIANLAASEDEAELEGEEEGEKGEKMGT